MVKRVFLFLVTNLAIIATLSIVTSLLGIHGYLKTQGIDYTTLAIFCAIWGTGGAFISLFMSRVIAKSGMGVQVIDPSTAQGNERALLNIVYAIARKTGLTTMPEVGYYDSPELNAFATGPSKNKALVAVSTGLLNSMNDKEVEAVLGHEISHVTNGDMVTMTLITGIVNSFALFFSRIIAYVVAGSLTRSDSESSGTVSPLFYILTIVFDIVFTLLGSVVVAAFSRRREYRADYGGAKLVGKIPMINALRVLESNAYQDNRAPAIAALKINHRSGWQYLFATHPPIEKRIERISNMP